MEIEGLKTERVTLEIDPVKVVDRVAEDLTRSLIKRSALPLRSNIGSGYDGGYFIDSDGVWVGVIDCRGRGSDINDRIREATAEELAEYDAIEKFRRMARAEYRR